MCMVMYRCLFCKTMLCTKKRLNLPKPPNSKYFIFKWAKEWNGLIILQMESAKEFLFLFSQFVLYIRCSRLFKTEYVSECTVDRNGLH